MQINQSNALFYQKKSTHKPAFGGVRLYNINIQRFLSENKRNTLPAYFTKLTEDDIPLIEKIHGLWSGTKYGNDIINGFFNFINNKKEQAIKKLQHQVEPFDDQPKAAFYMVESAVTNAIDKIKNLAMVSASPKGLYINYIQSVGEVRPDEKVFGAGSGMLYGICRQAEALNKEDITLLPSKTANDWYKKLGFEGECGICWLPSRKFKAFQKNIEQKYNY